MRNWSDNFNAYSNGPLVDNPGWEVASFVASPQVYSNAVLFAAAGSMGALINLLPFGIDLSKPWTASFRFKRQVNDDLACGFNFVVGDISGPSVLLSLSFNNGNGATNFIGGLAFSDVVNADSPGPVHFPTNEYNQFKITFDGTGLVVKVNGIQVSSIPLANLTGVPAKVSLSSSIASGDDIFLVDNVRLLATRADPDMVAAIMDYDPRITDINPFIEAANELVTEICAPAGYSADRLTQIETWLASHFLAVRDPRYQSQSELSASASYQGQVGMNLSLTTYGQQAMLLDTKGGLAWLDKHIMEGKRAVVGVAWLGTLPQDRRPYGNKSWLFGSLGA